MANPTAINADGSLKVVWVPTIAVASAPTVAEVTGVSAIDLTCYLTADGFTPATDEQSITDDRLCSRQTFEGRGRFQDSLNIAYVYQAQGNPTDNKAYETLVAGALGFVVARWAADFEDPLVAADVVDVYPAEAGVQMKAPPEANSKLRVTQKIFIRDAVQRDVAIAA